MLKGWRNYVCLQRLENAGAEGPGLFDDDVVAQLASLRAWAERTADGSL
jgi:ATP-dependent DNA helicase DinG